MTPNSLHTAIAAFVVFLSIASSAIAAPKIVNGGFEADGAKIAGSAGYCSQGNTLTAWTPSHPGMVARNVSGGAFIAGNTIPEGANVCIIQNLTSIKQLVEGFEADKVYRLTLRANGRPSDAPNFGRLEVRLNDTPILGPIDVPPVEAKAAYQLFSADFRTGAGAYALRISQLNPADGTSVIIDAVTIAEATPPLAENVVEVNRARILRSADPVRQSSLIDNEWMWFPEAADPLTSAPVATRWFRKPFEIPEGKAVDRAFVTLTADNGARVWCNGRMLGWADSLREIFLVDVQSALTPGCNILGIAATNGDARPNPAGLIGKLVVTWSDAAEPLVLPIDATWKCSDKDPGEGWMRTDFDDAAWPAPRVLGRMGDAPWGLPGVAQHMPPDNFPEFRVPGCETAMGRLRDLFYLHYRRSMPLATMWDAWMPMSSLWVGTEKRFECPGTPEAWRTSFLKRRIDGDGYVSTHQHLGLAHSEGWPFPMWTQAGTAGWHFSLTGTWFKPHVSLTSKVDDWVLGNMQNRGLDPEKGWTLRVGSLPAFISPPKVEFDAALAPFIRLEWVAKGMPHLTRAFIAWTTKEQPEFNNKRRMFFLPTKENQGDKMAFFDIPIYNHIYWKGTITQLRFGFENAPVDSQVTIKSIICACDTRQNVNNSCFIQGSDDYLRWTGDREFLVFNISRMRNALNFAMKEFDTRNGQCVTTPWVGHDGRSGLEIGPDGKKIIYPGRGIGNNYWDLLPFGGKDCLATIYYYDAVRRMARWERLIAQHPEWGVPISEFRCDPDDLERHAWEVKSYAGQLFWNKDKGRFVAAIDVDGKKHDYGYTFVNLEAIYYDFATEEQAKSILDWIGGRRQVKGDTSQGADIYHWRFGPRASTRRNLDYYVWPWSSPETIPWGYQVQDGGGVLGFTYHDMMARLRVLGPDNAWARLKEIMDWYGEVQAAGGYREYYQDSKRGTLQGGGPPGGLGMDEEFFESILVPQVMLYGFLGVQPRIDGLAIAPRLPKDWPELTITRVRLQGALLDLTGAPDRVRVTVREGDTQGLSLYPPAGRWTVRRLGADGQPATPDETLAVSQISSAVVVPGTSETLTVSETSPTLALPAIVGNALELVKATE